MRLLALFDLLAVNHAALETSCFVDDAFEQAADGIGAERPLAGDLAHVLQDVFLPIRLIDLDSLRFLQPPDLADAARALVEETHQHLVHAIDVLPEIVQRHKFRPVEPLLHS